MLDTDQQTAQDALDTGLYAFAPLNGLAARLAEIDAELDPLLEAQDRGVSNKARKLRKELRAWKV